MVVGPVRVESIRVAGDRDKNNFREMVGAEARQQGIEQ